MPFIIMEPCMYSKDTSCVDVCPVDCIDGARGEYPQLYIQPEECIDCGLCLRACPVEAILPEKYVPPRYYSSIVANYEHFGLEPPEYSPLHWKG